MDRWHEPSPGLGDVPGGGGSGPTRALVWASHSQSGTPLKLGRKEKGQHAMANGDDLNGSAPSADSDQMAVGVAVDDPENRPGAHARPAPGTEPFGSLLVRRGLVNED